MTPADIAALRALVDAATPGPWRHDNHAWSPWVHREHPDIVGVVQEYVFKCGSRADAEFVTAARSALPALLDRVEELEREVEHVGKGQDRAERNERELHAENIELRVQLDDATTARALSPEDVEALRDASMLWTIALVHCQQLGERKGAESAARILAVLERLCAAKEGV